MAAGGAGSNSGEGGASGGVPSDGGQSGGGYGGAAGNGGEGPSAPLSYGCQVSREDNQLVRGCEAAGLGKVNAPCFSAADCLPALACVSDGDDTGRCLKYCCDAEGTCSLGTYCAERQLRRTSAVSDDTEPPRVPVCVPADDCSLEDVFPCPKGTDCRCKGDTACMVVRADRTTTCLTPGEGEQGEACPCAWNHVCSSVTQKCVKICRTDPAKNDCGEQKCQASSELPQNFGVCVGPIR